MPFMIIDERGLYSTGGNRPRFVERSKGKVWRTLGQLKGHLAMFRTYQGENEVDEGWEVVEVQLAEVGTRLNAANLVQPACDAQAKRQAQYKDRYAKEQADREKAELNRLMKKYSPAHAPGEE